MGSPHSNAETLREAYDTFNRGDRQGAIERFWHPDLVFHELPFAPDAGTYRGYEGLRQFYAKVDEALAEVRYEPEELSEEGDRVLAAVRMSGRGRETGIPIELRFFSVFELRDGRIASHRGFMERALAEEALARPATG